MVNRVVQFITRGVEGLHTAAYIVAALTFGSQVLALLRDRVFATVIGPGETLDYYYAAFKLPDFYFALFASLFSAYVLLPLLAKEGGENAMRRVLGQACVSFLILMGIAAFLTWAFADEVAHLLFPEFMARDTAPEFLTLFSLMLVQPIILGLSGVLSSATQLRKQFFAFSLSPILYNVGIVAGAFLVPTLGSVALAYGVLCGTLLSLLLQVSVLFASNTLPIPSLPSKEFIRHLSIHAIPRALALSFSTLTILVLTIYASTFVSGSVTLFSFASNVGGVPLTLVGAAYSVAAFPTLAALYAGNHREEFVRRITDAMRHIFLWSSLATVLFIVLRAHIVRIIFGTGLFGWDETRLTAALLALFVASLVAQGVLMLLSRGYYAQGKTYLPFIFQGIGFLSAILCAYFGVGAYLHSPWIAMHVAELFRIGGVPHTEIVMLALAFSIGQLVAAVVAFLHFSFLFRGFIFPSLRALLQSLLAATVAGFATYGYLALLGGAFPLDSLFAVIFQGASAGVIGTAVFFSLLFIFKNREADEVRRTVLDLLRTRRTITSAGDFPQDQ
jgi:putative peptidoglycan lipid II flippase